LGELIPILILTYTWQIPLFDLGLISEHFKWIEFPVTFIFSFWLVNAFNLIDGINGLAGSIGFFSLLVAAYLSNSFSNIICFSFAGALLAFLFFNIMKPKVFMGDGGSLPLGFCLAFAVTQLEGVGKYDFAEPLLFFISATSLPLFDMFRVFVIRLFHRKNPFKGDKNHLHHLIIELGYSHLKATLLLTSLSIFSVLMSYLLTKIFAFPLIGLLVVCTILMTFTFLVWRKVRVLRHLKNRT
jgi:UDP-N-acetylmuramyl pentapeptide phosphotransferase/UDP-N-acetylglucosamine-1-phosphate transferase